MMMKYKSVQHHVSKWLSSQWIVLKNKPKSFFVIVGIFALIPMVIFGPVYQSGYIFLYDMQFSPHVHFNWESISQGANLYHSLAVLSALKFLSFVLPMDIVQKVLLSTIFLVAALGVYRSVPVQSRIARLLAGLMYSINPFTYDRLMAGHWLFLLAYCLTPFVLKAFYNFYTNPTRKTMIYAVLWWASAVVISAHHLLLLGLLFVVLGVMFVRSWRMLFRSLIVPIGVLALNLWWIIPAGSTSNFTQSFGIDHLYAFATRTDPLHGIWVNMLSLQGFWHAGWQSVKDIISFWPLVFLLWLAPVFVGLAGLRSYTRNHRKLLIGLLTVGILALVLAAGPHPAVWQLNTWLHTHVPGLSGMREAQKFLALLALMYAFLAAFGIDWLLRRHRNMAWLVAPAVTIAVILMALPIFWGAHGQMKTTHYPDSWQRLHDALYEIGAQDKVVVLPWSIYASDTFASILVGNPARVYFGDKAIVSQRMNLPGIPDQPTPGYGDIEEAITTRDVEQLVNGMQRTGAKYILITDPVHRQEYDWLIQQPGLRVDVDAKNSIIIVLTKQ